MVSYVKHLKTNNSGSPTNIINKWEQLRRFLILGTEGGTYYCSERSLTIAASNNFNSCLVEDYIQAIDTVADISFQGRAPKNDAAILLLAQASASTISSVVRKYALSKLNTVCRTGTHLFQFVDTVQHFRGWGRLLREAVADWYESKDTNRLAYQLVKYQNRNDWCHRDVVELAYEGTSNSRHKKLFNYLYEKADYDELPSIIQAFIEAKTAPASRVAYLIEKYKLPRECVPTTLLNNPTIWHSLLLDMPMTALIRNLGKMQSIDLLRPFSEAESIILGKLNDPIYLKNARLHPFTLLLAWTTYSEGRGKQLTWTPNQRIVAALEDAFYQSFSQIERTSKRYMIGLDVSGSMELDNINNTAITPRVASACMAMTLLRSQPNVLINAFSGNFIPLRINKNSSLDAVVSTISKLDFNYTDCSLPMIHAINNNIPIDTFIIYTDSETNAHSISPADALRRYRDKMGIDAKLIVAGMTATEFSIADPNDDGMLDVVGFDSAAPQVISEFS